MLSMALNLVVFSTITLEELNDNAALVNICALDCTQWPSPMLLTTQSPSMKVCMHNINLTAEARSGGSDRL